MLSIDKQFFKQRNEDRNYLHFDKKSSSKFLHRYILNSSNIKKHSFYPFISYTIIDQNISNSSGKLVLVSKKRLINYPSHIDSNIYAYYSKVLEQPYERYLSENSLQDTVLAFRKVKTILNGKEVSQCNIHFSKNIFDYISQKSDCLVLCYDITKFFDNLNHQVLKENWMRLLDCDRLPDDHYKVYSSLTRFASVDKKELYKELGLSLNARKLNLPRVCSIEDFREKVRQNGLITVNKDSKGIPQGSPISGLLSNIYMMDFDEAMSKCLSDIDGKYFRYCDDMIFVFDTSNKLKVECLIKSEIKKLMLSINSSKTQEVEFKNGLVVFNPSNINYQYPSKLQYLGLLFDGENVYLRETGLSKYHRKMKKAIRMRTAHYKQLDVDNRQGKKMYMRRLNTRFTYIGKRNYISYVFRVAEIHGSKNVKKQVKGHYRLFNKYLNKKTSF